MKEAREEEKKKGSQEHLESRRKKIGIIQEREGVKRREEKETSF